MRAVNLLPEGDRRRVATGRNRGSGYLVVGALALVLVALVSYTLTANQITSRNAQADQAGRDADEADKRAAQLGAFGDFAQTKQTREASVKSLAGSRFDWERLSLEMARVMPPGVFVTEVNAAAAGSPDGATGAGGAGGASGGAGGSSPGSSGGDAGPQMKVTGCAPTQPDVATTMVRLRSLHRAKEVDLEDSTREEQAEGAGASAPAAGGTTGGQGCGSRNGRPYYKFMANVRFEPPTEGSGQESSPKVPQSLGGGA
jgi:Tfp pilus assembly protein PilN